MRNSFFLFFLVAPSLFFAGCTKSNGTGNSNGNGGTAPFSSKVKVETYAANSITNSINGPGSMCMDQLGYLYIAETDHNVVIKIDPVVQTVGLFAGMFDTPGCTDDPFGSGAPSLTFPENLWIGSDQQIYIGDYGCGKAKIASTTGEVASLGYQNPYNLSPSINAACKDYQGNIYLLDTYDGLYEVRAQDQVLVTVLSGTDLGI
ncbi:MAG: hypothetical protein JST96_07390, partial [Bacteroidetes bacterium]|nr:hypothetical protein [Bacteroidota bacterium]